MANEKTRAFLQDPEFKRKLIELGKDPKNLMSNMQDHRVMEALAVLLEIDLKKAAGECVWLQQCVSGSKSEVCV